jgi:hypothetical protein
MQRLLSWLQYLLLQLSCTVEDALKNVPVVEWTIIAGVSCPWWPVRIGLFQMNAAPTATKLKPSDRKIQRSSYSTRGTFTKTTRRGHLLKEAKAPTTTWNQTTWNQTDFQ